MTSPQGQDQVSASLLGCPLCGGSQIGGPYTDEREGMVYFACISRPGEPCAQVYGRTPDGARERWNTRRAPPPAVSEVREAVARIVDPQAWDERPKLLESAEHWRETQSGLADRYAQDADRVVARSLAKADAILALPLPRMGEGPDGDDRP